MTTVSLVLGGGGARGYAHIGVIEALEARGYSIQGVAGSSMGALVGGLYAAGALDTYKEWVMGLSRLQIIALLDVTFSLGAIRGNRLLDKLVELAGDPAIESLAIPFTAVATDIIHHKEVWFQRGSLQEAIRASIAVPGVFQPVVKDHRVLVDGGVLNPLPIVPVVALRSDLIIAVDLNGTPPLPDVELPSTSAAGSAHEDHPLAEMAREEEPPAPLNLDSNLDIIMSSIEVMQGALSQYKIAGYPPDLLIQVPTDVCQFHDFHRAKEVIKAGWTAANEYLDRLEQDTHRQGAVVIP